MGTMREEDLAALHVGVIARDPAALTAFEAAVRPLVRGMLRNKGLSDEDADEFWNDAFLVAVERAAAVEPLGIGLRRLALTVAYRRAVDRIRQEVHYPRASIEEAEGQDSGRPIPLSEAAVAEVRRCLDEAKPLHSQVIEMASRGLTAREIGLFLDVTELTRRNFDSGPALGSQSASRG